LASFICKDRSWIYDTRAFWSRPEQSCGLLIFADRPNCHNSTDLVIQLFDRDAHLVWFPANTSQVIQPLDGEPYANLKLKLRNARDDETLRRTLEGQSLIQVVAEVTPHVEREAFTEEVVKAGFVNRGVWPFNPQLIMERSKAEFLKAPNTQSDVANEAQRALTVLITEKQGTKAKVPSTRVSGIPNKNTLYTPKQLIDFDKEKEAREKLEADEKAAKKKEKAEAKQRKKEEKEAQKKEKDEKREAAKKAIEAEKAAKKKALEEKKAAKAREKEAKAASGAKRPRSYFANEEFDDDEFIDKNDENDYPVNLPANIVPTKRVRKQIDYNKFSRSGDKVGNKE